MIKWGEVGNLYKFDIFCYLASSDIWRVEWYGVKFHKYKEEIIYRDSNICRILTVIHVSMYAFENSSSDFVKI